MIDQGGHIHFIAIGGSAMHNLAINLKQSGFKVTGSDDEIFEPSKSRLSAYNLLPDRMGWHPDRITSTTKAVILGMHARKDNPELKKALQLGLAIYSFPDFVYEASRSAKRVVIAGSHGKTTITSIIMHVLKDADKGFDYLVGAGIKGFENMVKLSGAPVIVLEGDEYLSSTLDRTPKFIRYNHTIGLISGIAWDHINAFPTRELYIEQFEKFIDNTPDEGSLVYYRDDEVLHRLIRKKNRRFELIPYSTPEYTIVENRYVLKFRKLEIPLRLFGQHNMQNIAGAIKVLRLLDLKDKDILTAIESFEGASNRLEKMYDENNIRVYKDFAHSPSKLKSTTIAVHELYPDQRIIACFELHTYSSLNKNFLNEYCNAFQHGNEKIVFVNDHTLQIKKMPPLSDDLIKKGFNDRNIQVIRSLSVLEELISRNIRPNSVFLFMSSGNFGGLDYSKLKNRITRHHLN